MEHWKNKWKNLIFLIVLSSFVILTVSVIPRASCDSETSVDVKFEILTGSGTQDYFAGDYFWYDITLTDSGTTDINATFTVTVLNTTGGILPQPVTYQEHLKPNDTTTLYPNYTRAGREEYYIYFMDTAGTYTVELTCDKPMTFYRYYEIGRYTVEHDVSNLILDVMPSYQKIQNDRWNQYMQESENYMADIKAYSTQAQVEASNTKTLAKTSIGIAIVTLMFSTFTLPNTKLARYRKWILLIDSMLLGMLVFLLFLF